MNVKRTYEGMSLIMPTKQEMERRGMATQIECAKLALEPESLVQHGYIEMLALIELFFNYLEGKYMDKKMAKVTKKIVTAKKDIKKHEPKAAMKVLKKAKKANVKLTKIDRDERDPMIKKCKKEMKKPAKKMDALKKIGVKLPAGFGKMR